MKDEETEYDSEIKQDPETRRQIEGHELTLYQENTKITTNCWTIIEKKHTTTYKKDILHPKTKEKPQQDIRRCAITMKSNPIICWVGDPQTGK